MGNKAMSAPNTFCAVCPMFEIIDDEKAEEILSRFVETTKKEDGCVYYGWTRSGNKVFCRETYIDGEAVLYHLKNVEGLLSEILNGIAKLDSLSFHAPEKELEKIKPVTAHLNPTYFTYLPSGFTNFYSLTGSAIKPNTFITIQPTSEIVNMEAFMAKEKGLIEKAKSESKLLYYGWTISYDTTPPKLFTREAYLDADAALIHLDNIFPLLNELLEDSIIKLLDIQIHGPKDQLELLKSKFDPFGAVYYETIMGFVKFSRSFFG
mmetsp:Transcript_1455/g.1922  ORF Transcript_1455/g.1922 Transcript_1455/m.1922 type:complete len:264 (-) Transcript_1455:440-1231(-)